MSFARFTLSQPCCSCNPSLCVNLYDPYTGTDYPEGSGDVSLQVTWGYPIFDEFDNQIGTWDAYQWPTGLPLTYLNITPGKGFTDPMTVSGYGNDSIIHINGTLSPPKPWFAPFNTGDCLCGPYWSPGRSTLLDEPCFGYYDTNVKMEFDVQPYPNNHYSSCFTRTLFCDIDVCDSGHLCGNVSYCPGYVNINLDGGLCYQVELGGISFDITTVECPQDGGDHSGGGCVIDFKNSDCVNFVSQTFLFQPALAFDSGNSKLMAKHNTSYAHLYPATIECGSPNFNCDMTFYDPALPFAGTNPFSVSCSQEVDLYWCDCKNGSISQCTASVNLDQKCNHLGREFWKPVNCPGTTDCCGNTVSYPGKQPRGSLTVSISITYVWDDFDYSYQDGCAEDISGFLFPTYTTLHVPAGTATITFTGDVPWACTDLPPGAGCDCSTYGPFCLTAEGGYPAIVCTSKQDNCPITQFPGTHCTDCIQTTIPVGGAYLEAIYMPGTQGDFNCMSFFGLTPCWDSACTMPVGTTLPPGYENGGPQNDNCDGFLIFGTPTQDPCVSLCGSNAPASVVYGNGTADFCNGVLMFTSCDGGFTLSASV